MTKQALVTAINSYTSARMTGDQSLVAFAANQLQEIVAALDIPDTDESDEFEEDVDLSDASVVESDIWSQYNSEVDMSNPLHPRRMV